MPDISDSLWLGAERGIYLYFQNESDSRGGWLFNQILLVILGHFFVNFIKADNSYLGKISEKLLDEVVLPLEAKHLVFVVRIVNYCLAKAVQAA